MLGAKESGFAVYVILVSAHLLSTSLSKVVGSIPGPVKPNTSPTARHRYDVSLELCFPGAGPRRCPPPTCYTLRRNTTSIIKTFFLFRRSKKLKKRLNCDFDNELYGQPSS